MDCIDDEGYFHTGDIAVVDENQVFSIVDRKKELIKYKGFQVPPAELEGILVNIYVYKLRKKKLTIFTLSLIFLELLIVLLSEYMIKIELLNFLKLILH